MGQNIRKKGQIKLCIVTDHWKIKINFVVNGERFNKADTPFYQIRTPATKQADTNQNVAILVLQLPLAE